MLNTLAQYLEPLTQSFTAKLILPLNKTIESKFKLLSKFPNH